MFFFVKAALWSVESRTALTHTWNEFHFRRLLLSFLWLFLSSSTQTWNGDEIIASKRVLRLFYFSFRKKERKGKVKWRNLAKSSRVKLYWEKFLTVIDASHIDGANDSCLEPIVSSQVLEINEIFVKKRELVAQSSRAAAVQTCQVHSNQNRVGLWTCSLLENRISTLHMRAIVRGQINQTLVASKKHMRNISRFAISLTDVRLRETSRKKKSSK